MQPLSRTETASLGFASVAGIAVLIKTWREDGEPLYSSLALSLLAFTTCFALIRWTGDVFIARGYKGRDMSKKNPVEIPETMGLLCALIYLLAIVNFLPFAFKRHIIEATSGAGNKDRVLEALGDDIGRVLHRFPLERLASYGFAYGTLATTTILGILDDSFDMRWRHKWFIPGFAALPMLWLYFVDFGVTHVTVPSLLRPWLGEMIELGGWYYLYMAMIAIFCPNSINMLAGINGIEVGQCIVIALQIIINDLLYISFGVQQPHPAAEAHLFSIYLLLPLLGVSLALLWHNWFPAKVFVGDTYCYFAGMVFAIVGILGHFSKTLLLLFLPQLFNFVYSTPQLFGLVPCPRHRLPRFNSRTGLLEPSTASYTKERPVNPIVGRVLKMLHVLRLLKVETDEQGLVTSTTNFTLINLYLVQRGPLREDRLALELLLSQAIVGLVGLWVRHTLGAVLFRVDNRF